MLSNSKDPPQRGSTSSGSGLSLHLNGRLNGPLLRIPRCQDAAQDPTAVSRPLLRIPNRPQDAVVLPVHPVLQCHYSLMYPLACVNTVYINTLMFLFHVAPRCAQLACGQRRALDLSARPLACVNTRLYQYSHVLHSCYILVCSISMWAKPEQSNASQL